MTTLHIADVISIPTMLIVIGFAVRALRFMGRVEQLFNDYPPHRHVNGTVIYPKGYKPTDEERLVRSAGTGV